LPSLCAGGAGPRESESGETIGATDETEAKEKQQPEGAKRPTWGVMPGNGVLLPDGANIGPQVPVGSVPVSPDKPRSPWGAINRPIEW